MNNYETILVDKKDWIGTITMNRPDRLNAMTSTMLLELARAFHQVEADQEIRVVILTGAGDAFSSGADIRDSAQALEKREEGALVRNERLDAIPAVVEAMLMVSKPIIASISGVAVGGGMTISLHCDIRIASEKARFGAVFARIGLIPEFGSTYMLSRIVGIAKACELVFTARIIDAAEAKEIGLVNQVVVADELKQATKEMASAIAKLPPFGIQMAKRGLYQGLDTDIRTQMQFEAMGLDACFRSADHAEAVKAFLEKREPKFEAL
jgi:enoyl-CoA hydratase/carnithine racemase